MIENVEFSYPKIFFQLKIFFMREIKGQSKNIAKNVPNGTFFGVRDAKGLISLNIYVSLAGLNNRYMGIRDMENFRPPSLTPPFE